MSLEGKTIARVIDLDYNGQALVFTDGTAAHFEGTGYETDGCSVELLTPTALAELEADHTERQHQDAIARERNIARRELKERIRRNVSPQAWANWRRVHVSPMEAMSDLMMESMRLDVSRQFYDGCHVGSLAVVPTAKTKARRT